MQRSLSHHICCDSGHCFLRARPNVRLKVVSLYKQGVLRTSNTRIRSYMYTKLKLYDIPFIMTQKSYRTYSLKISAKFLTSTCTRTILWLNVNVLYKFVTSWVTCTVRIRVKIGPQNLPPFLLQAVGGDWTGRSSGWDHVNRCHLSQPPFLLKDRTRSTFCIPSLAMRASLYVWIILERDAKSYTINLECLRLDWIPSEFFVLKMSSF